MYVSNNGGRSFEKRSVLPFDTSSRLYGAMGMLDSGSIAVYIYNNAEDTMDYVLTNDGGRTWSEAKTAHVTRKIRNKQLASLDGCCFLTGRSGHDGEKDEQGPLVP